MRHLLARVCVCSCLGTVLVGVFAPSPASAATKQIKLEVKPQQLHVVRPPVLGEATLLVLTPGLQYFNETLLNNQHVVVFLTGQPGKLEFALLVNGEGGVPDVYHYFVTVKGDVPPQPPEPQPEPIDGFAGEVYKRAKAVKLDPAKAKGIATNFGNVASMIAAGGISDIRTGMTKLRELNTRVWPRTSQPFVEWLEQYLAQHVRSVSQLQLAFSEVEKGLKAL